MGSPIRRRVRLRSTDCPHCKPGDPRRTGLQLLLHSSVSALLWGLKILQKNSHARVRQHPNSSSTCKRQQRCYCVQHREDDHALEFFTSSSATKAAHKHVSQEGGPHGDASPS